LKEFSAGASSLITARSKIDHSANELTNTDAVVEDVDTSDVNREVSNCLREYARIKEKLFAAVQAEKRTVRVSPRPMLTKPSAALPSG